MAGCYCRGQLRHNGPSGQYWKKWMTEDNVRKSHESCSVGSVEALTRQTLRWCSSAV